MKHSKILGLLILPVILLTLSACSDDKPQSAAPAKSATASKAVKHNHIDAGEASDSVKQKFAAAFSKNCVVRELKNSVNKDIDEKRYTESCDCIAKHISENLDDVDAEKYLQEHEDTQTLEIKFDTAAYFCLQAKPQPKGPHLFGK
jgi:hypothetical protein